MGVCIYGFCNVCVRVCKGFVMFVGVYVRVLYCVSVCMYVFCYLWVCVCMGFFMYVCVNEWVM